MAKTYNPKDVIITVDGVPMSGYAPDEFLSIDYDEDQAMLAIGADGEGARSLNANEAAAITITVMQTSNSNAILAAFSNADRATGAGKFALAIKTDGTGGFFSAPECWVQKPPANAFAKEVGTREWVLRTDRLTWNPPVYSA